MIINVKDGGQEIPEMCAVNSIAKRLKFGIKFALRFTTLFSIPP